jgi:CRP/FNR family transcriptional regulator, cyclic AMP receptor protein
MVDVAELQRYSLFGGLRHEEIDLVRPYLELATWQPGEYVLKEGETNGRLHFVLDGLVRVTKRNRTLVDLGEGDTFGEVELLDVMPAVASIVALKPTKLAMISNKSLHSLYKSNPSLFAMLVMNLARDLARRLRRMDELMCTGSESEGDNNQK